MNILSKFKDYYDSMRCYSNPTYCSDDFTYKRVTKEILIPRYDKLHFTLSHESSEHYNIIIRHIIGFCGEWYFMYSIKTSDHYYNLQNEHLNYTFYSNPAEAIRTNLNIKAITKSFKSNNWEYDSIFRKNKKATLKDTINHVLQIYTKYEKNRLKEFSVILNKQNLFKKYNTPVLEIQANTVWEQGVGYQNIVTINPNLEKLSFYKLIEGNIAYQELEMYLGNELLPQDNAAQITDSLVLAANHGFNKASFRKAPSKADKRIHRQLNKERKRNATSN